MDDREALLRSIRTHPADDTPRLVYADWVEENDFPYGDYDRATVEFIRLSCHSGTKPGRAMPRKAYEWLDGYTDWKPNWTRLMPAVFGKYPVSHYRFGHWRGYDTKNETAIKIGYREGRWFRCQWCFQRFENRYPTTLAHEDDRWWATVNFEFFRGFLGRTESGANSVQKNLLPYIYADSVASGEGSYDDIGSYRHCYSGLNRNRTEYHNVVLLHTEYPHEMTDRILIDTIRPSPVEVDVKLESVKPHHNRWICRYSFPRVHAPHLTVPPAGN